MKITLNGATYPIAEENCTCPTGRWCCTICGTVFPNNITADIHESEAGHKCQWLCFEHGVQRIEESA